MPRQINYVRASYYISLSLLSILFSVSLFGSLNGRPLVGDAFLKSALICGPMIALVMIRTDKEYLIKAIPLRLLLVATGCLGLAAFFLARR